MHFKHLQNILAWLLALWSCDIAATTSGGAVLVHVTKIYINTIRKLQPLYN